MKFIISLLSILPILLITATNTCEICKDPLRIMVLFDESGTVGKKNFDIGKIALNNLVDNLDISNKSSQLGIIKFSTKSTKVIDISPDIIEIKKSIDNMKYKGGWTNTKSAINLAKIIGKDHWNNTESTRIILLITDGIPQLSEKRIKKKKELIKTLNTMDKFKETYPDVDVISIAIGDRVKKSSNFFKKISDFPVFLAKDYEEVLTLFGNLTIDLCTTIIQKRTLKK